MRKEYCTTRSSIWFTAIVLPFTLVFLLAGVACFVATGLNVFSVVFTLLGLGATFSALNYTWSKTSLTESYIQKKNLLSGTRTVMWRDIQSWRYVEGSEAQLERLEISPTRGRKFLIYANEAESVGLESLLEDMRTRLGDLEFNR